MQGVKRRQSDGGETNWPRAVVLIIGWMLIFSLAKDVWRIRSGFDRISEANLRLEAEKSRNQELKNKLEMVMTEEYKERLIREKLSMQKEGEVIVVLPDKKANNDQKTEEKEETEIPNWEKWWNLIK